MCFVVEWNYISKCWHQNGNDFISGLTIWYLAHLPLVSSTLHWRHNGRNGVSNHQPHECLLNRLFGCRSTKTSKLRVTDLCAGNISVTGGFPAQMASDAENVSFWWRHHGSMQNQVIIWDTTLQESSQNQSRQSEYIWTRFLNAKANIGGYQDNHAYKLRDIYLHYFADLIIPSGSRHFEIHFPLMYIDSNVTKI